MAKQFQLTAQLKLQAPNNIKQITANIRQQLGAIDVKVNIKVDPSIQPKLRGINSELKELKTNLAAIGQSTGAINAAVRSVGSLTKSIAGSTTAVKDQGKAFQQTTKNVTEARTEMEAFGIQSALAIRRFAAFSVGTAGIIGFVTAIKNGVQEAIKFDREMVRLQQVTGSSMRNLKGLSAEVGRLAKGFGVSSSELIGVSSTLAQAGLTIKETKIAMEALAKSSLAPSFDNLADTTEGVIAAMRQFSLQASDVESALGSINSVAAAFAVESEDIITAIRTTGGVFASASKGVAEGKEALNQFISVFTSVRQTTRESAESIATGLRTIFTRIQRPRTIEFLKEFGVNLQDLEGKFVGPYEAIKRLSEGLSSLDNRSPRFAQITEELGGYRQLGKVIPAIQQFAVSQRALQIAQQGTNSLTEDAATAQNALAVQIAKTREGFLDLIRTISQSSAFSTTISGVLKLADGFIALGNALAPIIPYLTAIAAIKTISGGFQFASGFAGGIKRGGGAAGAGGGLASLITGNKGFAKGGLVPGVGNEDSVLTSLMPGEFVVRKDAVKAIGAHNMEKINRYGEGQFTRPSYAKLDSFAQANGLAGNMSSSQFKDYLRKNPDAFDALAAKYGASAGSSAPASPSGPKAKRFGYGKAVPVNGDLIAGGSYGGLFFQLGTKEISNSLVGVPVTKLSKDTQALVQQQFPGATAIKGQPHQLFINKQHGDAFDQIAKKSFDSSIAALLDNQGGAKGVASSLGISEQTLIQRLKKQTGFEQLAGSLFEGYVSILGKQVNEDRGRTFDFNPANGDFAKLFGQGAVGLQHADAKYTSSAKSRASLVEKAVNTYFAQGGAGITLGPAGGLAGYAARDKEIRQATGKGAPAFIKRASGGYGQAGSPALVMPGEFIVNATTAKNLGPGILNQLNHADKFKRGGRKNAPGDQFVTSQNEFVDAYQAARIAPGADQYAASQANGIAYFKAKVQEYIDAGYSPKDAAKIASRAGRAGGAYRPNAAIPQQNTPLQAAQLAKDALGSSYSPNVVPTTYVSTPATSASPPPRYSAFTSKAGAVSPPISAGGPVSAGGVASAASVGGGRRAFGGGLGQNAIYGAAIAAPLVADAIGNKTRTTAAIGGALNGAVGGAALGASVGSIIPGVGTAVGAGVGGAVGGIAGLVSALKEAKIKEASDRFEKAASRLEESSKNYAAGKITTLEQSHNVGLSIDEARAKANAENPVAAYYAADLVEGKSSRGEAKRRELISEQRKIGVTASEGFYKDIQPAAGQAEDFFRKQLLSNKIQAGKLTGESSALTDNLGLSKALAYSGPGGKAFAASQGAYERELQVTGKNKTQVNAALEQRELDRAAEILNGTLKEETDSVKKVTEATKAMDAQAKAAAASIEILSEKLDKVSAYAGAASANAANSQIGIDAGFASVNGASATNAKSRQDIFNNNSAYSAAATEDAIAKLGLNKSATSTLTQGALSTKALSESLPTELLRQFEGGGLENVDVRGTINSVLGKSGLDSASLPPEIGKQIEAFITDKTGNNTQAGGGKTASEFFSNELGPMIKKINADYLKTAGDLNKGLEEANKRYVENINRFIEAQAKVNETAISNRKGRADAANNFREAFGSTLNFQDKEASETQAIRSLSGINNFSAKGIGDRRDVVEDRLAKLNARRGTSQGTPADAEEFKSLLRESKGLDAALKVLATSTTGLAAIQDDIAKEEANRNKAAGNLSDVLNQTYAQADEAKLNEQVSNDITARLKKNPKQQFSEETLKQADAGFKSRIANAKTPEEAKAIEEERIRSIKDQKVFRGKATASQLALADELDRPAFTVDEKGLGQGGNAKQQQLEKERRARLQEKATAEDLTNRGVPDSVGKDIETQRRQQQSDVINAGNSLGIPAAAVAGLQEAANTFAKMPSKIDLVGTHTVNINHTGLEGISEGVLKSLVETAVEDQMRKQLGLDASLDKVQQS